MSIAVLSFPPKEAIVEYLASISDLVEQKVIESVAEVFANQTTYLAVVQGEVMLILWNLNMSLSHDGLRIVATNLTQALIDCANGKQMQLTDRQ